MVQSIPDFNQTNFMLSISRLSQAPADSGVEVAFAGRSNAGKSSAINTITGINKLAKTSKTPGRTQLINFFCWYDDKRLVDLPGFGFAKVPGSIQREWHILMGNYFAHRKSLKGLVLLMDIRHPLRDLDWQMLDWCQANGVASHILLSKCDKLSRGKAKSTLLQVAAELKKAGVNASVQLFSSLNRTGLEQAREQLVRWLVEAV